MGFLLDTNVVSELRKAHKADRNVRFWQSQHEAISQWISVISLMETKIGIVRAQSKDAEFAEVLSDWYHHTLLPAYSGRIIDVSLEIAEQRAEFESVRTVPYSDALLAATAKIRGLTIATRNTKDFEGLGIDLINPWKTITD